MLTWELFKRYLLSKRSGALVRTIGWLCMVAMCIGVFALIVVMGVMEGFNSNIRSRLLKVEPHLVVTVNSLEQENQFLKWAQKRNIRFQEFETQDIILRTLDGLFSGAVAKGINKENLESWLQTIEETKPSTQMRASWLNIDIQPREVILGIDLARSLGILEGDQVVIIPPESLLLPPGEVPDYEKVTVRALVQTDVPEMDSHKMFFPLGQTLKSLNNTASVQEGYEIFLSNPENFKNYQPELKKMGLKVESWADRNEALFFSLKMEKIIMATFLSLAILITVFSIVSVMVLLMTQKRQDMGLLMSLGLSRKRTRQLFTRLGFLLSIFGLGTGVVLGAFVVLYLENYPLKVLPSDIYYDSTIPAVFRSELFLYVSIGCATLSLLAAWLPARNAITESPAEILKGIKGKA